MNGTMANDFAGWLRKRMGELGLTQADLARESGIAKSHVSRLLSGESRPTPDSAQRLSKALNLPPDTILIFGGQLPGRPTRNARAEEWLLLFTELDDEQQQNELEELRFRVNRRRRGRNARTASAASDN